MLGASAPSDALRSRELGGAGRAALLLERLDHVTQTGEKRWKTRCPVPEHRDRSPSLSIAVGNGGKPLVWCFAGCRAGEVLAAVGLTWADLLAEGLRRPHRPPSPDPRKATLAEVLARERRQREGLAFAIEVYRVADLARELRAYAAEAHRLANEVGEAHPDAWALVGVAARAQTDAAIIETALDHVELRRVA